MCMERPLVAAVEAPKLAEQSGNFGGGAATPRPHKHRQNPRDYNGIPVVALPKQFIVFTGRAGN